MSSSDYSDSDSSSSSSSSVTYKSDRFKGTPPRNSREQTSRRRSRSKRRHREEEERRSTRRRTRDSSYNRRSRDEDHGRRKRKREPYQSRGTKSNTLPVAMAGRSGSDYLPPSPSPPAALRSRKRTKRSDRIRKEREFADSFPVLTKMQRRIFVGNLGNTNLSESELKEIFTEVCRSSGILRPEPIHSVWLHRQRNFCFVEFRSMLDAKSAMASWDRMMLPKICKNVLRVGPPRDRVVMDDSLKFLESYVLHEKPPQIPEDFDVEAWLKETQKKNYEQDKNQRAMDRVRDIHIPLPGKGSFRAQKSNPNATRVLCIEHPSFKTELVKEDTKTALLQEIRRHLARNGRKVLSVKHSAPEGRICALFNTVDSAIFSKEELHNNLFSGEKIRAKFFSEDRYERDQLASRRSKRLDE